MRERPEPHGRRTGGRRAVALAVVFAVALATRLLWIHGAGGSDAYVVDPLAIDGWGAIAASLAQGDGFALPAPDGQPTPSAWRAPVYPLVLAGWFVVWGDDPAEGRLLQAVLGATAAALLLGLAIALTGSWPVATAASLLWAVQYKDWDLSLRLWSESLVTVVLLLAVPAWRRAVARASGRAAALAGAVIGVAALTRPEVILAVPFFAAIGARATGRGNRLAWALALLCGAALVVAPWMARNARLAGHLVLGDTSAGFNLYQGALSAAYVPARDFSPHGRAALALPDEFARDAALRARAWERIAAAPGAYLRRAARRAAMSLVNLVDPEASWRPTRASLLALPLYALAVLGGGLLARRGQAPTVALVGAMLGTSVVAHALTVAMLRTVLPYLPYLCVFATVGAVGAAQWLWRRRGPSARGR